jgi:hypothetical protein
VSGETLDRLRMNLWGYNFEGVLQAPTGGAGLGKPQLITVTTPVDSNSEEFVQVFLAGGSLRLITITLVAVKGRASFSIDVAKAGIGAIRHYLVADPVTAGKAGSDFLQEMTLEAIGITMQFTKG